MGVNNARQWIRWIEGSQMADMSTVTDYSVNPDFVLIKGVLNIYLPLKEATKDLTQYIWDLKKPDLEYYDQKGHLIATEWYFEAGQAVLTKLAKRKEWQNVFNV